MKKNTYLEREVVNLKTLVMQIVPSIQEVPLLRQQVAALKLEVAELRARVGGGDAANGAAAPQLPTGGGNAVSLPLPHPPTVAPSAGTSSPRIVVVPKSLRK